MTLMEQIRQLTPETVIKIGANFGRGYFWIGKAGDLDLDGITNKIRRNLTERRLNKEREIKHMLETAPNFTDFAKAELKKPEPRLTKAAFEEQLDIWLFELKKANVMLNVLKSRIDIFEPLEAREVIECVESDPAADPGVIRILIKGKEEGEMWYKDEAQQLPEFSMYGGGEECES